MERTVGDGRDDAARIHVFMQRFCNLGLIEINSDHFLIKENKLTDYLA